MVPCSRIPINVHRDFDTHRETKYDLKAIETGHTNKCALPKYTHDGDARKCGDVEGPEGNGEARVLVPESPCTCE